MHSKLAKGKINLNTENIKQAPLDKENTADQFKQSFYINIVRKSLAILLDLINLA